MSDYFIDSAAQSFALQKSGLTTFYSHFCEDTLKLSEVQQKEFLRFFRRMRSFSFSSEAKLTYLNRYF